MGISVFFDGDKVKMKWISETVKMITIYLKVFYKEIQENMINCTYQSLLSTVFSIWF